MRYVSYWLQADIQSPEIDFRLTPNNGHSEGYAGLPVLTPSRPTGDEVYGHQAYRNSEVCVPAIKGKSPRPYWICG